METAALILQGKDDYTAEEPVAGILPLQRIIRTLKYAGVKRVVVAGDEVSMNWAFLHITRMEAEFIYSTASKKRRKTASYQSNAITYLKDKCDRLLIVPAYYPLFDIPTVKRMVETDAALAAPVFKGKRGYPVLVSAEYFDAMVQTDCDCDALFNENPWKKVEVKDEGVAADVTEPINAERIAAKLELRREVRPGFKLTLRREQSFYGPGMQEIVRLAEESGSLKRAYELMGMASSYARRLITETEAGLGFKIFGQSGRGFKSNLVSEEMKEFAAKYKAFHEDCANYIEESYKRHFG